MKQKTIYYILLLAFCLRIIHISYPLIGVHSWRQTDTAAIARNYYEHGMRFLYPQVDWGGKTEGYVECEFPLYSYTVALLYSAFGFSEIWGRLLSVICSLVALFFLYKLIREVLNETTALWAVFLSAVLPLNVFYSRTFMPESAMLMSSVLGIYFFYRWITTDQLKHYFLSIVFIALACLLKLPALYLGLPLLYLCWTKYKWALLRQWRIWLFVFCVFIPVGLWYYHAHQLYIHGGVTFGVWEYGSDKWGNWDLISSIKFWRQVFMSSIVGSHFAVFGGIVFLIGFLLPRKFEREYLFDCWLFAVIVYFIIVAKGNFVHEYYQLPFMLPAVVYVAKVFERANISLRKIDIKSIALAIALVGIIVSGVRRNMSYLQNEDPKTSEDLLLADKIKQFTDEHARILCLDQVDPTILYHAHRKGWRMANEELTMKTLQQRRSEGARYFAGLYKYKNYDASQQLKPLINQENAVYDDGKVFIVDLTKSIKQ